MQLQIVFWWSSVESTGMSTQKSVTFREDFDPSMVASGEKMSFQEEYSPVQNS